MMIRHYAAAALLAVGVLSFALSGCALVEKLETISDAQKAVGSAGAAVAAIRDKDASVLTKAQLAACAAQDGINLLGDMLTSKGYAKSAKLADDASAIFGYGCTWTLPAK